MTSYVAFEKEIFMNSPLMRIAPEALDQDVSGFKNLLNGIAQIAFLELYQAEHFFAATGVKDRKITQLAVVSHIFTKWGIRTLVDSEKQDNFICGAPHAYGDFILGKVVLLHEASGEESIERHPLHLNLEINLGYLLRYFSEGSPVDHPVLRKHIFGRAVLKQVN